MTIDANNTAMTYGISVRIIGFPGLHYGLEGARQLNPADMRECRPGATLSSIRRYIHDGGRQRADDGHASVERATATGTGDGQPVSVEAIRRPVQLAEKAGLQGHRARGGRPRPC